MAKGKTKLEKMSKDERTSLAYALATNLAKHGKPQTPKNERKLTKGEENKKEDHVMKFKDTFDLEELKNPKKADLNKDGKLSSYEKTRGAAIEKNINEAPGSTLTLSQSDMDKLHKDGELEVDGHKVMFKELMDFNDPVLVKQRADKMEREKAANAPKSTPKKSINPNYAAVKNASKIKFLEKEKAQLMRDMEQEAEPEGGPIANEYGRKLNRIDNAIAKLRGKKAIAEAKVDYDFSERELIRVLKQLKRGASTEIDMIKAFTKALGRDITKDELFKEVTAKLKKS